MESVLKLEVLPSSKFKERLREVEVLPLRIICQLSSVSLFYCFREYYAERSVTKSKVNPMLVEDTRIQTFLHSIDCKNIFNELVPFWNKVVV